MARFNTKFYSRMGDGIVTRCRFCNNPIAWEVNRFEKRYPVNAVAEQQEVKGIYRDRHETVYSWTKTDFHRCR